MESMSKEIKLTHLQQKILKFLLEKYIQETSDHIKYSPFRQGKNTLVNYLAEATNLYEKLRG